ncbi:MAG TPA: carboxypeptidase regulatory-like domain-containing protein [Blastocatellia bacterium]|jgi:TonB-dependent Receptor Plug Domain.
MSSIKLRWSKLLSCLFCAMFLYGPVMAQTVTGAISGTVVDTSDNAIVGATVTIINVKTGDKRIAVTNESGGFSVPALQPDVYTIKIEQRGFRSLERQNTVLSANENLALGRIALDIGQVTEVVTTVAEGATVEKESSDLTGRLTSDQIELISTKGRSVASLLTLLPGVAYIDDAESVGDGFGTDLPSVNGQRGRSTVSTINGLNASEPSGSNKISLTVNQDAIAEVKILRNSYSPEFGNNGGAQINIVTKSGKKEYFGAGYLFMRNEALNANSFFNNKAGLPRAKYRHTYWGANVGGPVQIPWLYPNKEKKNLFFFYSLEVPHTITPTNAKLVTVPTERERNGDFSQSIVGINTTTGVTSKAFVRDPLLSGNCNATDQSACFRDPSRATPDNPLGLNIIPRSRFNTSGAALLNYFPIPNRPGGRTLTGNTYNYLIQKSVDVPKQSQVVRVDFKPTEKDSFFVNAIWWRADNEGFDTSGWPGGDNNRWGISSHYLYKEKGLTLNWVRLISPTIVNEASVSVRHGSEGFIPSDGEVDRLSRTALNYTAPQLFPGNNTLGTIPRATGWGGLSQTTVANINWLDRWGEIGEDYILPSITDNLTINRYNHNYKVGFYLERIRNGEAPGGQWSGAFNFSSNDSNYTAALGNTGHPYANALIGSFRSYSESSSRPHTDLERALMQWYVQDQWKAQRRLTLNYGVRMGWFSQWAQRQLDASNFDPARFNPSNSQVLYRPFCVGGTPATAACTNSNRRALNPITGQLLTNTALVGTFVPGAGNPLNGIAVGTDPGVPQGFKDPAAFQWEPRFGFALSLFESGKTVLRGHGGVYHSSRTGGGTTGGNLVSNPPFQRNITIDFGAIDNLANLTSTALERPTGLNAVEVNTKVPTIYNYSLGIQQDIGHGTIVEISYVGSLARHLGERRNINAIRDGMRFVDLRPENRNPFSTTSALGTGALGDDFLRPFQGYGDINVVMGSGSSNYNALQVQVLRRYAKGFQYGVAYTWHKTLDYAPDDSNDVNFLRPYRAFNYGPADHDQTHIFTANYIWDIPRLGRVWDKKIIKSVFDDWQLSGTTSFVSGLPKSISVDYNSGTITIAAGQSCPAGTVQTGPNACSLITDFTGGEVNARPFMTCNPNSRGSNAADGTPIYVDVSCFSRPTEKGQIGNASRNLLRRPGLINFNLAMFKNFRMGEKVRLQFRWETYNLFNHTNFNDIDANLVFDDVNNQIVQTNARFGQPISTRPPRVMQGSLRISF